MPIQYSHVEPPTPMDDPLDELFQAAATGTSAPRPAPPAQYQPRDFTEPCQKCNGTGSWRGRGQCFACKGQGKLTFKTSRQDRAAKRTYAANAKAGRLEAWIKANPEVHAWIRREVDKPQPFTFALAMEEALIKYSSLTDGQQAACQRLIERDKARTAERVARVEAAPVIEVGALEAAFEKARNYKRLPNQHGVRKLTLRLDTFIFKPASKHPGTIYVTDKTEQDSEGQPLYLGKIVGGRFQAARACGDERAARVVAAAADPAKSARAYGERFSQCCACGADLTNEDSITRMMGPTCAAKYGF